MKKSLLIAFVIFSTTASGQNLVPNPSFEQYTSCPNWDGEVNKVIGWDEVYSADFFHYCATNSDVIIPNNLFGYQYPYLIADSAYCGLAPYVSDPCCTEFLIGQLTMPLTVGQKYYVSFLVNAAEKYPKCFTNKLGVLFSTVTYTLASPPPINNFAHVYSDSLIKDTVNWVLISDSFTADSAYTYINLGGFFDNSNITISCTNPSGANDSVSYYFIDNVCVSEDSLTCADFSVVEEDAPPNDVDIYPNPTNGKLFINNNSTRSSSITVLNYLGQVIVREWDFDKKMLNISNLPSGIYFISVANDTHSITHKIIKITNP